MSNKTVKQHRMHTKQKPPIPQHKPGVLKHLKNNNDLKSKLSQKSLQNQKQFNHTSTCVANYTDKFEQLVKICQSISKKPLPSHNSKGKWYENYPLYQQSQRQLISLLQCTDETIKTLSNTDNHSNSTSIIHSLQYRPSRAVKSSRSFRLDLPEIKQRQRQCEQDDYFCGGKRGKDDLNKLYQTQRISKSTTCLNSYSPQNHMLNQVSHSKKNNSKLMNQRTRAKTKSSSKNKQQQCDRSNRHEQITTFNPGEYNIRDAYRHEKCTKQNKPYIVCHNKCKSHHTGAFSNVYDNPLLQIRNQKGSNEKVKLNVDVRKLLQKKTNAPALFCEKVNNKYTKTITKITESIIDYRANSRRVASSLSAYQRTII